MENFRPVARTKLHLQRVDARMGLSAQQQRYLAIYKLLKIFDFRRSLHGKNAANIYSGETDREWGQKSKEKKRIARARIKIEEANRG